MQERKADRRSKEIEQRKESQNTHKTRTDMMLCVTSSWAFLARGTPDYLSYI